MQPLISILIPVRNASAWLRDCLESICEQTCADWECIIVDDHSTDDSMQRVSGFAFFDPRFRVVKNEGSGLIDANKTALKHAKGKFITQMDADEIMPENTLKLMSDAFIDSAPKKLVIGKFAFYQK